MLFFLIMVIPVLVTMIGCMIEPYFSWLINYEFEDEREMKRRKEQRNAKKQERNAD